MTELLLSTHRHVSQDASERRRYFYNSGIGPGSMFTGLTAENNGELDILGMFHTADGHREFNVGGVVLSRYELVEMPEADRQRISGLLEANRQHAYGKDLYILELKD